MQSRRVALYPEQGREWILVDNLLLLYLESMRTMLDDVQILSHVTYTSPSPRPPHL